jgi:hypothetical protein
MKVLITKNYVEKIISDYGYQLDDSKAFPYYWKRIPTNDLRTPFAFTIITIALTSHSFRIEGLNELRFIRSVKAGKIKLEKEEDIEKYRVALFETTLETKGNLESILPFLEKQLDIISFEPTHSDIYHDAIHHIQMISEAANQIDMEDEY